MTRVTRNNRDHIRYEGIGPTEPARQRRSIRTKRDEDLVPLEANLQPPVLRDDVIVRGELVDLLREQSDVPVVVVTGPPGYGKTTLLVQWADEDPRPFSWLTVDRTANDPAIFATYLALALQRLGDVDRDALDALREQGRPSDALLARLAAVVAGQQRPFVLVIDDAEFLTFHDAARVLMTVAKHLPTGSQLVICGRTVPAVSLGKLRAERRLVVIGPDRLRLSPAEAAAVLAAAGVDASADTALDVLTRTEGWPAALHLGSFALGRLSRQRRDHVGSGTLDDAIADYLRERVLASLPLDEQRFLTRTSILTRLSGPLCDAVLDVSGSSGVLRDLARRNVFLTPLDNREQWYRCHGMFREMLRQVAARQEPQIAAMLHSRASHWLEDAGDYDQAIDHAQKAGQVARAARLVWSQVPTRLASGEAETLRRWLGAFTNEQLIGYAGLSLTAAWCALESGRPVDQWLESAERGIFDATETGQATSMQAAIALLHAECGRSGIAGLRADADRAAELQAADDLWRPYAQYLQAIARLMAGDPDAARLDFITTERLAATLGLPAHSALCHAQLAALALESADWEEAARLAQAGSATLAEHEIGDSAIISVVHCVATIVLSKGGQTDEAKRLARRCMHMIALADLCSPWMAVQTRYLLARARLLLGDTVAARVLLSEARSYMHGIPDAVWLRDRLDEAWTQVEKFPLATGVGPSALTSAEFRVLQLLPTHLSFEQIGKRLSISRNTVKTQAIATYRKLGVSSRGEAVRRARALSMIQS